MTMLKPTRIESAEAIAQSRRCNIGFSEFRPIDAYESRGGPRKL
jgi:hypothetical protein